MKPVLKGTTAECLAHFAKRSRCIEAMSEMLPQVQERTIERWMRGAQLPTGENLLRVRVVLSLLNYEVDEFATLDPMIQKVCKMFVFELALIDDLVTEFGYDRSVNGGDQILRVLRGAGGMRPERRQRVEAIIASFDTMIAEAEQQFRNRFVATGVQPVEQPVPQAKKTHESCDADKKALLDSLAHSVAALLPLAERVLTDNYTPEDREYVRLQAGGNGVFKAANALYRLCGERARTTISNKQ